MLVRSTWKKIPLVSLELSTKCLGSQSTWRLYHFNICSRGYEQKCCWGKAKFSMVEWLLEIKVKGVKSSKMDVKSRQQSVNLWIDVSCLPLSFAAHRVSTEPFLSARECSDMAWEKVWEWEPVMEIGNWWKLSTFCAHISVFCCPSFSPTKSMSLAPRDPLAF